jgi:hypothetical protein
LQLVDEPVRLRIFADRDRHDRLAARSDQDRSDRRETDAVADFFLSATHDALPRSSSLLVF